MMNFIAQDPTRVDPNYPMDLHLVFFMSAGYRLHGRLFVASGQGPHPNVILLHGFPGEELNFDIAHALQKAGYNTLIFHYRGCWGSEGDWSWANTLEDTEAAIDFLSESNSKLDYRINSNDIVLAGHSLGGFSALMTSIKNPIINRVASFAGFNFGSFAKDALHHPEQRQGIVDAWESLTSPLRDTSGAALYEEALSNVDKWDPTNYINAFAQKKVLLIGAANDTVAPLDLHHNPLVRSFSDCRSVTHKVLKSGHGFLEKRIELTMEFLKWLEPTHV